jgi:hypothetical protein
LQSKEGRKRELLCPLLEQAISAQKAINITFPEQTVKPVALYREENLSSLEQIYR